MFFDRAKLSVLHRFFAPDDRSFLSRFVNIFLRYDTRNKINMENEGLEVGEVNIDADNQTAVSSLTSGS